MTDENLFSTRDIYLAATLLTMKFALLSIDYQIEGERKFPVGYFNFESTKELREVEMKYFQGALAVEPRTFVTNMRGLKAQVSNIYKGPRVDQSKFERKS